MSTDLVDLDFSDAPEELKSLMAQLEAEIPGCTFTELDGPTEGGNWFLSLKCGAAFAVVEYRPSLGFGCAAGEEIVFGEGPREVCQSRQEAVAWLKHQLA